MATTKTEEALTEQEAALAQFAPRIAGLENFVRLDLQPESATEIAAQLVIYRTMRDATLAARDANRRLVELGFPEVEVREVPKSVFDDINEEAAETSLGVTLFEPIAPTTSLNPEAGKVEPK